MPAQCPTKRGGKPRNKKRVRQRFDCRTEIGRRVRRLVTIFVNELGGRDSLTELTLMHVVSAAELKALCEQSRSQALRGDAIDIGALVRLESQAGRAFRLLGLDQKHNLKATPSLSQYLAQRAPARSAVAGGATE